MDELLQDRKGWQTFGELRGHYFLRLFRVLYHFMEHNITRKSLWLVFKLAGSVFFFFFLRCLIKKIQMNYI